ncbi:MAG: hypothetical protein MJE63_14290 [Proteobacteria bacterium]|nr:hypothetical protein [Pseudomonadota bacterium]
MKNIFTCLFLIILFCSCSAKDSKFRATVTPVPPIVVYDQKDLQQLDLHLDFKNLESTGEVSLLDIPILNRDSDFIDRPLQRAIAVGYPYKCGASSRAWNRKKYEDAA